MPIENATTIRELNSSLPEDTSVSGAVISEDDDHMRMYKNVLKLIFKGITGAGFSVPITVTETELNYCLGLTSNLQTQINDAKKGSIPIGGCIMYSGIFANIPSNFLLCTGASGTPNLIERFVYGTNTESEIDIIGGTNNSVNISHNHTADHAHTDSTSSSNGTHVHDVDHYTLTATSPVQEGGYGSAGTPDTAFPMSTDGVHNHPVTIDSEFVTADTPTAENGVNKNIPPYLTLAWIQRQS